MRIQAHWCACMTWQDLNTSNPLAVNIANKLVDQVNNASGNGTGPCSRLSLQSIQFVQAQKLLDKMEDYILPNAARPKGSMIKKMSLVLKLTSYQLNKTI